MSSPQWTISRPGWTRLLWLVLLPLVLLGVASATLRTVHPSDLMTRIEPVRRQALAALHLADPFADQRAPELARADGRFAAHPVLIVLHAVTGGVFLLVAPFQFSLRIRGRHLWWHRWSGRILLLLAIPFALTGLYFGLLLPFGGAGEVVLIALVGGLFLLAMGRAYRAIRRRDVARHREWMIRLFAVAISISVVRVAAAALDLALTPAGVHPRDIFVISLWAGWGLTIGAAELWIRRTRPRTAGARVPEQPAAEPAP